MSRPTRDSVALVYEVRGRGPGGRRLRDEVADHARHLEHAPLVRPHRARLIFKLLVQAYNHYRLVYARHLAHQPPRNPNFQIALGIDHQQLRPVRFPEAPLVVLDIQDGRVKRKTSMFERVKVHGGFHLNAPKSSEQAKPFGDGIDVGRADTNRLRHLSGTLAFVKGLEQGELRDGVLLFGTQLARSVALPRSRARPARAAPGRENIAYGPNRPERRIRRRGALHRNTGTRSRFARSTFSCVARPARPRAARASLEQLRTQSIIGPPDFSTRRRATI